MPRLGCWAGRWVLVLGLLGPAAVRADEPPAAPPPGSEQAEALARAEALDDRAHALYADGKLDDALLLARQSLAIREEVLGKEHRLVATSLGNLAHILQAQGSLAEARPLFQRALEIDEKALGKDHPDVATDLGALGVLLQELGALAEARPLLERALEIRERALGPDHPEVADDLSSLATLLLHLRAFAEAEPLLQRALTIQEKALGADHVGLIPTLVNLAALHQAQAAFAAAQPFYERALALHERAGGEDGPDVADLLNNLGALLHAQGAYAKAQGALERALRIRERTLGRDHPDVAQGLNNLAEVLRERGAYAQARPLYERALAIEQKVFGPDDPKATSTLQNLALLHRAEGDFAGARLLFERVVATREKALGPDHPSVATAVSNLASLLQAQGSHAEAQALFARALAIDERAFGPDRPELAADLNNLGTVLSRQGDLPGARRFYERALGLLEKAHGRDHPHVAKTLGNLALVLEEQGERVQARALCERALAIERNALGDTHPALAPTLAVLAMLWRREGALGEAQSLMERVLAIDEAALGKDHVALVLPLNNLAMVLKDRGEYAQAQALCHRALGILEGQVRAALAALSGPQRLALLRSLRYALDNWLELAPQVGLSGYAEVLRFRGVVGRAESAERVLARRATGEERALLTELQAAQHLVARLANEVPSKAEALPAWQKRYAEGGAERTRLARALSLRSAPLRGALERMDLGLPDVQASLGEGTALVDLLRLRDRYLGFVVGRTGDVVRVDLGAAAPIEQAAAAFVAASQRGSAAPPGAARGLELDREQPSGETASWLAAGGALRTLVFAPLEARLPAGTHAIYLVPDAALAAVPFAALPGRSEGRLLIDEYELVYLATAQDLVPRSDAGPRGTGALLVGGVDYERAAGRPSGAAPSDRALAPPARDRAPNGATFRPLPQTRAEVEHLRERFGPDGTVLLGSDATEARLRGAVRGRRWVHIATHGFAREDLLAGLGGREAQPEWASAEWERQLGAGHDPMLLSALALAGANPRDGANEDDGILTALEASYLDLDGVELVALSACETARGTAESGEGVQGLVSAFQMAGARHVLASLWQVDDEATRRLMDGVYERLLRKDNPLTPAQALRESARALRDEPGADGKRRFTAPRFWAAFVAYGR